MRRAVWCLMVLSLVVAACGGGDTDAEASSTSTVGQADSEGSSPDQETTTTKPEADDEPVATGEEGTGTATIGDMTFDLTLTDDGREMCNPDFSGLFFVNMLSEVNDAGEQFVLSIQAPNAGGNAVVQAGSVVISGELWIANSAVYEGLGSLEGMPDGVGATAQVDGNTISGTGVFYEDRALSAAQVGGQPYEAGVLEGTFQATCPAG